jgi:hypothetical protein
MPRQVTFEVLFHRQAAQDFGDDAEREVFNAPEADADLADVELLSSFLPRLVKPLRVLAGVEIERHVLLLRGERDNAPAAWRDRTDSLGEECETA